MAPAGTGNYVDATGGTHSFTINEDGTFRISGIEVYDGWNYISINDTNWNYQHVGIQTANGRVKPQFVAITSPVHGTTGLAGTTTVTGTISDPVGSGYKPSRVYASVSMWDSSTATNTHINYSSDPMDQKNMNNSPIIFDGTNFSFSMELGSGKQAYIKVNSYDDVTYVSHSHSINVNDPYGGPAYHNKARFSSTGSKSVYQMQESLKRTIMMMSKDR